MNNSPPAPPPIVQEVHRCFSGDPKCSGSVPCDACLTAVRLYVLPTALARAGLGPYPEASRAFIDAFMTEGWSNLHTLMVQRHPQIGNFAEIPILQFLHERAMLVAQVQALEAKIKELEAAKASQPTLNGGEPSPPSPAPASPIEAKISFKPETPETPKVHIPEIIGEPRRAPLTAEEIAATRIEAPASEPLAATNNGTVLANIFEAAKS